MDKDGNQNIQLVGIEPERTRRLVASVLIKR